ncbi:transmembrane protease serine 6 [Bombina bombina]|uniref:transmembrane protease serine 6 n=1 Tax=Bombina bombina TaxID=8345 RepID=UPI00235ABA18|nr:transmembrane protease serine 6 [Bombina bombina]
MSLYLPPPDSASGPTEMPEDAVSETGSERSLLKRRDWLKFAPLWIVVLLVAAGGLTWYLLEVSSHPVLQASRLYAGHLRVVSHELTQDLTRPESSWFRTEAAHLQKLVKSLVMTSDLAPYYNTSTVYAFGEGSLMVYFWVSLEVPETHAQSVSMSSVKDSLTKVLQAAGNHTGTYIYDQYHVDPNSLTIMAASVQDKHLLTSSTGCYRYSYVQAGKEVHLRGPDYLSPTCVWHLQGPPSYLLMLRLQWTRSECRDRLAMYDSPAPLETHLITSHYGCSRQEPVSEVLSSGSSMLVVWKQGLYSYYDPFILTAQTLPIQDCREGISLKPGLQIQGQIRTPYYPSYYPPKLHCTWNITVPSFEYGVVLRFEGYMLTRRYTYAPCTQGEWHIQNRRMCGLRVLQSYAERVTPSAGNVTISFTCPSTLTGPGVQASYSLFNISDPCPGQFLCALNGLCVPICDGVKDCSNELDERNCVCPAQYQCSEVGSCVDIKQVCNGKEDCINGTDEEKCQQAITCGPFTYKCEDGNCVKKPNPECDSIDDCADGSDEKGCNCGLKPPGSRLVGGTDCLDGEWPWQASLQVRGEHLCGGTLVSDRWILSAAHCFNSERYSSPDVWTVYLGKLRQSRSSQKELSFKVKRLVIHPFNDEDTHDYDVALLLLDHSVPQTAKHIQPICLPASTHHFATGSTCWVTGWGAIKEDGPNSEFLKKVDVKLMAQDLCSEIYRYQISPRMLCAGYNDGSKDACQGDSGSPLVCQEPSGRWFQAGLVSWGAGCGIPRYFGVYSRMTRLVEWIQNVTA